LLLKFVFQIHQIYFQIFLFFFFSSVGLVNFFVFVSFVVVLFSLLFGEINMNIIHISS